MKKFVAGAIMLLVSVSLWGQEYGEAQFTGDHRIDSLIRLHKMQNLKYPYITGYRIQIYKETGNDALDSAWSVKTRFEETFEGTKAYISFREPYYRVRVGDFRTRLEALKFLDKVKRVYPYAWEIKDKIRFKPETEESMQPPNTPNHE